MSDSEPTYVTVNHPPGITPSEDIRLASVPEVCAMLGVAVLDALRAGGVHYLSVDDDGMDVLSVSVEIPFPRLRLLWLLERSGVKAGPGFVW